MKKLNILKIVSIWVMIFCMGSVSVLTYNETSYNEALNLENPQSIVKEVSVGSLENKTAINPYVNLVSKANRQTISKHGEIENSFDSFISSTNIGKMLLNEVANTPVPSCVAGPSTANVSSSSTFQAALNSTTIDCINITSGFTITLTSLGQVYSTITKAKTIVNSTNTANPINVNAYLYSTNYQILFYTSSNVDITLYNITINYSFGLTVSNHNLFYGFKTINLNKTKILQDGVTGYSVISNDNKSNIIGSNISITDTVNITNGSIITGASSEGNVILANNINVSASNILTHMSNKAGIYALQSMDIREGSIIDSIIYNNGAGINVGESLEVRESTLNVSFTNFLLQVATQKYGVVLGRTGNVSNSTVNVLSGSSSSNLSLLFDSRTTGNDYLSLNATTLNINDITRIFSGKGISLHQSIINQSSLKKYKLESNNQYNYISSDTVKLTESAIYFNTESEKFMSGYSTLYSDLFLDNSSIVMNYTGNFISNSETVYFSEVNNLTVNNSEVIINHFGGRYTSALLLTLSSNPATLGFSKVNGNVSISGSNNSFFVKKAVLSGTNVINKNYDEGFNIGSEHTFIKMMNDGIMGLTNTTLNYNGNVSLLSTEKNVDINLMSSKINANMSEGTNSTAIASHSLISLKNRNLGSIDIFSNNSEIIINHNSNYNVGSTSSKPTVSIIDDVNVAANEDPKISYVGSKSVFKVYDKTTSGFVSPNGATTTATVLTHKLAHNASPLEFSSMTFNENSTFDYNNNNHFYPLIRTKSFIANNSNVYFNFANYYHGLADGSMPEATNYYHLFYDNIAGTLFDFNLNRSSSNYIGANLRFSISSSRNNLTPYILTNGSANINASIDYYNYANYGGTDYGREGIPNIQGNTKQTVTVTGNRVAGSTLFSEQTESFEQFGENPGNQTNINLYPSGIPTCQENNQYNSRNCIISESKPFFSAVNRRKDAVFGDYIVQFDELLSYDESNQEYFVTGMASEGTSLSIENSAVFESIPQSNGLYKFKLKVAYDSLIGFFNVKASNRVKEGTTSPLSQNNSDAQVNFTRVIKYNIVQPVLNFTVDNLFDFGTQTVYDSNQYLSRKPDNIFNIQISDARYNSPGWILEMCVQDEMMTTFNQSDKPMYNDLVYKNSDNTYTVLYDNCANKVLVAENLASKPVISDITWDHTQGIQLAINNPWLIIKGYEYEGKVRFILTSK